MLLPALIVVVICATRAEAYIDPGTGSLVTQLLFGGVAGLIVVVKLYWRRLLTRFGLMKESPDATREQPRA